MMVSPIRSAVAGASISTTKRDPSRFAEGEGARPDGEVATTPDVGT